MLGTGVLTVVTLGLYRFWQKTRVRRWIWSALRPGGYPLEYVGDPFEKLLGFLIAVVILAFYIGVVNLGLMFASFALFQGNIAASLLSLVGVVPLWFYARYRARRYLLARTRWLGLRFGLAPGAWGFALRALWHSMLTALTLGLLWPRMTFKLEAYRTDRTFFGTARMAQGGQWTMLFGCMKWHFVALALGFAALAYAELQPELAVLVGIAAVATLLFAIVYYRVETLKRLTSEKTVGPMHLSLDVSIWRVLRTCVLGYGIALLCVAAPASLLAAVILEMQSLETLVTLGLENLPPVLARFDTWTLFGIAIASYFAIFLLWSALTQAFVRLPLLRLYASGLTIRGTQALRQVGQRPRDTHVEAEGFAEALDVGASL